MIKISLNDGSIKEYPKGYSVLEIAKDISEGFARNVISASLNNETLEISSKINGNGKLEFYTWDDDQGKKAFWHSTSHVMAQAIRSYSRMLNLQLVQRLVTDFITI